MALKPARLQWSGDGVLQNLDYGDIYFQWQDGLSEKRYVFLDGNRLGDRFADKNIRNFCICELGFGSGLNFLLTAQLWLAAAPEDAILFYTGIENRPILLNDLTRVHAHWPELADLAAQLQAQYPPLLHGFHHIWLAGGRIRLMLAFGDVDRVLPDINGRFDAWYLDGFSPRYNPDMWMDDLYPAIAARTAAGGTLASFTSVGAVRRGLKAAGFIVEKIKGHGKKWSMTIARMNSTAETIFPAPVTVLGAGIAGASVARSLADRGHAVTVIDKGESAGAAASGNAVGILYPKLTMEGSPLGAFYRHAFSSTQARLASIQLRSWQASGVTHLDRTPEEANRHQKIADEINDPAYAAWHKDTGLVQPKGGYLSPPDFCRALLDHPRITTRFGETVNTLPDGITVIALGMDSTAFNATSWLPLSPLRGQITTLTPTTASTALKHVICFGGYLTPASDGLHYTGATFQKEPLGDAMPRDADNLENLNNLTAAMPHLGFTPAHIAGGRAAWRATTPDKLPMIGPAPNHAATIAARTGIMRDNLYLATGFGAFGMTAAPLAGEIIAGMIAGTPLPLPNSMAAQVAPVRFIMRDIKRRKV